VPLLADPVNVSEKEAITIMTDYQPERDELTRYDLAFPDDPGTLRAEIEADQWAPEWDSADSADYQARLGAGLEPEAELDYTDTGHPVMTADVAPDQPYVGMSRAVPSPGETRISVPTRQAKAGLTDPEPEAEL
jgi:hypothetical protein